MRPAGAGRARALLASCLLVGGLVGCDDPTAPPPADDRAPVTEWVLDKAPLHGLHAISGSSTTDVVAVGAAGTVLRLDGSDWQDAGPTLDNVSFGGVWSAGDRAFFASGVSTGIYHCQPAGCTLYPLDELPGDLRQVSAIWGRTSDDVYAAGYGNDIVHFDGQEWTAIEGVSPGHLGALWGFDTGELFAVGSTGVTHYDGSAWLTTELTGQPDDVWGSSPDDVYVVAESVVPLIYHYDGATWQRVDLGLELPEASRSSAVWGSSANDVWVVGSEDGFFDPRAMILHYDGTAWSRVDLEPVHAELRAVWGSGPTDVWAAGTEGTLLHYDGTRWTRVRGGMGRDLMAVTGDFRGRGFAAGAGVVLQEGTEGWDTVVWSSRPPANPYTDVGVTGTTIYLAGNGGLESFNDPFLHGIETPSGPAHAVRVFSASRVFVGGLRGITRLRGMTRIGGTERAHDLADYRITDLSGSSPTEAVALGKGWEAGDPQKIFRYNGSEWTELLPSRMQHSLAAVWSSSPTDIFAVGRNGLILHWDGETWEEMDSGTRADLLSVAGSSPSNVYAVGASGTVVHYDGESWTPVTLPFTLRSNLQDVWLDEGEDVIAVGEGGTILRGRR